MLVLVLVVAGGEKGGKRQCEVGDWADDFDDAAWEPSAADELRAS